MIPQRYEVKSWNEWDGVSLSPAEDGDLLLYADADKWVGKEVAIIQNEKELAEEHLRLDTITWEKALKKKDAEIRKLSARIQNDSRPCPPCEHLDEKIKEVAALTDKLQEAQQNYDTAFGEWHRCIEEIAALKEKIKEQDEEVYCPTCGACGEEGCCPPDRCEHLKCFYGEHYAKTYRELEAENTTLRSLLDGVTEIKE